MLISGGLKPLAITGYLSGVADPCSALDFHRITIEDSFKMFVALRSNVEHLEPFFSLGQNASNFGFDTAQRYCEFHENDPNGEHFVFFSNGQFVGQGSLKPIGGVESHRQIALWVDRLCLGKGFALKIVEILRGVAFYEKGFSCLFYTHDKSNLSSERVAIKSGFEPHCEFTREKTSSGESGDWKCWVQDNPLLRV